MAIGELDLYKRLEGQACRRALTEDERKLGMALEAIFASGRHDFDDVARELNARGVAAPTVGGGPCSWTAAVLLDELRSINTSLDHAYLAAPPLGSYN